MRIQIIVVLLALFLGSTSSAQENTLYATAAVTTSDGAGTATAVKVDAIMGTYLVTNWHVVKDSLDTIDVTFYNQVTPHRAYVHSIDVQNDIAVLITRYKHDTVAVMGKPPDIFTEVICVGNSFNIGIAPSRGMVTGVDVLMFGSRYFIRMDCNISPGNSGGGLYALQDGVWKYVGMPSAGYAVRVGFSKVPVPFLGFSVRIEDIRWHLYRHGVLRLPPLNRSTGIQ